MDTDSPVLRHAAIILQRFGAAWFGIVRHKRHTADLQPLGGGEKLHVHRVVVERIDECSFFKHQVFQSMFLCFQCTGDADWSAADYDHGEVWVFQIFSDKISDVGAVEKPAC